MRRLSVAELEMLVALDSLGSIGAVARAVGLSQPTVSVMIKKLERNLGFELVLRTHSGSELTSEGRQVAEAGRAVLERWVDVDDVIAKLTGTVRTLQVAASLTIAEYLIPRWIGGLPAEVRDEIEVTVCNSEKVMDHIEHKSADLGFVEGSGVRPHMRSIPVGEDTLKVVVAASHQWAGRGRPITVTQLLDSELALREAGSGTREVFVRALQQLGMELPAHSTKLGSTSAIKNWVKQGNGVAIISGLAVEEELLSGVFSAIEVRGLDLRRTLNAVLPAGDIDYRTRFLLQAARALTA